MSHWGKTSALVANLAGGSLLSRSWNKEEVKLKEGSSDLSADRLKIDVSNKNANKSYPSKSFFLSYCMLFSRRITIIIFIIGMRGRSIYDVNTVLLTILFLESEWAMSQ